MLPGLYHMLPGLCLMLDGQQLMLNGHSRMLVGQLLMPRDTISIISEWTFIQNSEPIMINNVANQSFSCILENIVTKT